MPIRREQIQKAINEAAEKERRRGSWRAYKQYEFRHDDHGGAYVVARPEVTPPRFESRYDDQRKGLVLTRTSDGHVDEGPFFEYSPLVSHPGLFLKFARLTEHGRITEEVWKNWVRAYGVLGLEQHDMTRDLIARYLELGLTLQELTDELTLLDRWGRDHRLYSGSSDGGPGESWVSFEREAHKAGRLLRIYEAATAKDDLGNDRPNLATVQRYAEEEGFGRRIVTVREAKGWALGFVGFAVQEIISEDCYPLLHQEGFEITQGWGFHTLLGAMYLQMAWLMTAKDEVRCKWCGRVIAFEQPLISSENLGQRGYRKPYKPRADKEFCDRQCKDRWYYRNVTAPKRLSKGSMSF